MRTAAAGLFAVIPLVLAACSAQSPSASAPAPAVHPASACGPAHATDVDGACFAVGPDEPADGPFVRAADGWGLTAPFGEGCHDLDRAVLGKSECVPLDDDCDAAFPPTNADIVVSTKLKGPNVYTTVAAALDHAAKGTTIALDSGKYDTATIKITRDLTIVGRCVRDTVVGNGKNNAIYIAEGANAKIARMTLTSASAAIAIERGTLEADQMLIKSVDLGVGVIGAKNVLTLRHSILEGGAPDGHCLAGMAGQGGKLIVEDTHVRNFGSGFMATDPNSIVSVDRTLIDLAHGPDTASGLDANAHGHIDVTSSFVRGEETRLVAARPDKGTMGSTVESTGTIAIRGSTLEQLGAELVDISPINIYAGAELALEDVTFRHQSPIGINGSGKLTMKRVAILGDESKSQMRAAVMIQHAQASIDAEGLAIPWAQGIGVGVGDKAKLDLRRSLIANVTNRGLNGQEAVLVMQTTASISDVEIANVTGQGIVGAAGGNVQANRVFIHDTHADGSGIGYGALLLHSEAVFEGCKFKDNHEGIVAAGSSVLVTDSTISGHDVALRAMDGMKVADNARDSSPNTISVADCTFDANVTRVSLETLPELNAPPFDRPTPSGK